MHGQLALNLGAHPMLACTLTLLAAVMNVIPGSELWGKWEVYKVILAQRGAASWNSNLEELVLECVDLGRIGVPAITYLPNGRVRYYLGGGKLVMDEFVRYDRIGKYGVALGPNPVTGKEWIAFVYQIKDGVLFHIEPNSHRDPQVLRQGNFDPLARLLDLEEEDDYDVNIYIMRRALRHQPHKPAKRE